MEEKSLLKRLGLERILVYGIGLLVLIVALFADLKISQSLYAPDNLFGQIFETAANIPTFALLVFAASLLFRFHPTPKQKWLDILMYVGFGAMVLGLSWYGGQHFREYLSRVCKTDFPAFFDFIYGLVYLALGFPFVFLIKKDYARQAFVFGLIALAIILTSALTMEGMKMLWLRPRYRTLVALYGNDAGVHWKAIYQPAFFGFSSKYGRAVLEEQGLNVGAAMEQLGITQWKAEEFYAFPSGHTMNVVVCACFGLASSFLPRLQGKEKWVRISVFAWGILTAISRILRGAHNLTDVSFAFVYGYLTYDLIATFLYPLFKRIFIKEEKKEEEPTPETAE